MESGAFQYEALGGFRLRREPSGGLQYFEPVRSPNPDQPWDGMEKGAFRHENEQIYWERERISRFASLRFAKATCSFRGLVQSWKSVGRAQQVLQTTINRPGPILIILIKT